MTVKDLIEHLKCLNPELEVFLDWPDKATYIEMPLELVPETRVEVAHVLIKPIL